MAELDDQFRPFSEYPGYQLMAPCMRDCDRYLPFNGCDNSGCWCKKGNLDRRASSLERCASTSCTFADMNTATDVAILSSIQVQYCVDRGLSPDGMTMPSTALATPTESSSSKGPLETGGSPTEGLGSGSTSGTGSATRTRPSSGPADTGAPSTSTSTSTPAASTANASLSTPAKAGIAIGAVFCVLLAVLIVILIRRRKRSHLPPAPSYPPEYSSAPPHMAPAPLHVQTSAPGAGAGSGFIALAPVREDVSPIEEKTPAFSHQHEVRPGVARKEVGSFPAASPPVQVASPAPTEVAGSAPPDRYEVHGNAGAGGYPGGGQGGRWVYEMQGGGLGRDGAAELGGGR